MKLSRTRCVILAAGISTRLRPLTNDLPKCLLTVGGKTFLERTVGSLLSAGISKIAVIVGFQADKIRTHLSKRFPSHNFHIAFNPNFASTNNAYSLLFARDFFEGSKSQRESKDRLLMLDADIIFHPSLLEMMHEVAAENLLAVRTLGKHDDEEVRVGIDASGDVISIGKGVVDGVRFDESVGVELFGYETAALLFDILEQRMKRGIGRTEYYETTFQEMIQRGTKIKAVDVGDLPVMEVDSKADLEYAEQVVIPQIDTMFHV
jgi:choline kinase